jgi:hypothetical protein
MYRVLCIPSRECEVCNYHGLVYDCCDPPNSLASACAVQHLFYMYGQLAQHFYFPQQSASTKPETHLLTVGKRPWGRPARPLIFVFSHKKDIQATSQLNFVSSSSILSTSSVHLRLHGHHYDSVDGIVFSFPPHWHCLHRLMKQKYVIRGAAVPHVCLTDKSVPKYHCICCHRKQSTFLCHDGKNTSCTISLALHASDRLVLA